MSLRITTTPIQGFSGSALPTSARVEWAGRTGHPSSYGLLAGHRYPVAGVNVTGPSSRFRGSLAGSNDEVRWGLPYEYESAVAEVVRAQPVSVVVDGAAHGEIGSSVIVFRALALLVCRVLAGGVPSGDAQMWDLRDRCWDEASRAR